MDNSTSPRMAYVGKANKGTKNRDKGHKTAGKSPFDKELRENFEKKGWRSVTVAQYDEPVTIFYVHSF